ncbi:MAG: o-succinylbenzoate synthase, partial [Duncaniella sp.]|nr:o-succinylbenzoate synthase [Duncaniella sp.]
YSASNIQIRLDSNVSMSPSDALHRLERLARYDIHSIEQPIRQWQWREMAEICLCSPIPVALDEELIGLNCRDSRRAMLDAIAPAYIILKPTLVGGWHVCDEWIDAARERGIGWWATSALESDIGLNAIAQWVATYSPAMPQGLGTGQLFTDNIPSPLSLRGDRLWLDPERGWDSL